MRGLLILTASHKGYCVWQPELGGSGNYAVQKLRLQGVSYITEVGNDLHSAIC
jgi:hypothetical protein